MKRLLSLILAVIMILSLGISAFAANQRDQKGSITINEAIKDQDYTIYRIFDLVSYDVASKNYSYVVNTASPWYTFVSEGGAGAPYIVIGDPVDEEKTGYYVEWEGNADPADFAKLAIEYIKANPTASFEKYTKSSAGSTTVVFDNLPLGYYLVDSTQGALCSLNTNAPNATIEEKNKEHTVVKKVQDASGNWADESHAYIGKTVHYQTTIALGAGAQNIVLHDIMSAGLTLVEDSFKLYIGNTIIDAGHYTVTTNVPHYKLDAEGKATAEVDYTCTFEIAFTNAFVSTVLESQNITVYYDAVVNEDAVIGRNGNPNETWLDYGDDNHTEKDTVQTFVWYFEVFKYTRDDSDPESTEYTKMGLAGASFQIAVKAADGTTATPIRFVEVKDHKDNVPDCHNQTPNHQEHPHYRVASPEEIADESITKYTTITTDSTGLFMISGLDVGTYLLTEIEAPDGYNMPADPVTEITLGTSGQVTGAEDKTYRGNTVAILNHAGTILPSTGGIGTTIFYILGGVLMVGAAVVLVAKRRMNNN